MFNTAVFGHCDAVWVNMNKGLAETKFKNYKIGQPS